MPFLRKNGLPIDVPPDGDEVWFSLDGMGTWLPNKGNFINEIEDECLKIHKNLAANIFGDLVTYYAIIVPNQGLLDLLEYAGLNSESQISKIDFERIISTTLNNSTVHQLLYLYDCRKLVSSIQECSKELVHIQGEFYKTLNLEPLFYPPVEEPDGTRYITSATTTKLHLLIGFLYIRMHSMLDYTTKLAFEVDHVRGSFETYPKLSSSNIQFSDKSKISINNVADTVFETNKLISEIEVFRNLIIHNGLLDDLPKAYKVVQDGVDIEKFILMPDRSENGHLEKYKNRNLFYSKEDKINLRLTELISDFQIKMAKTLEHINQILVSKQNQEA